MREWLVELVGEGMAPIASFVLAAAIVVILVFLVIWIAKRALGGQTGLRSKGRGPRLAVMDVTAIDQKRKLVLVRRDEVEHLILIGGQNDLVVEASILRVAAGARTARSEPSFRPDEGPVGDRRPAAPAAPPQRLPTAMPAPTSPRASAPRPADGATASPLIRTVPRAPASSDTAIPAASEDIRTEPAMRIDPVDAPPERPAAPTPPERREPSFADMPASPAPVVDTPTRDDAATPTIAAAADEGGRAKPAVGSGEAAPPVRPADPVVSATATGRRIEAQPQEDGPSRAPATAFGSERATPPRQASVDRGGQQGLTRTQIPSAPSTPESDAPIIPRRVPIGGGGEPVRRPAPLPPAQPRSMATPTYPLPSPPARQEETATALPADRQGPPAYGERERPLRQQPEDSAPRPESATSETPPIVTADSARMREITGRPAGPSSAVIAAAERQREALLARPGPMSGKQEPAAAEAPPVQAPDAPKQPPVPMASPSAAEPRNGVPPQPEQKPTERKPLEVRSFAATIQSGRRAVPEPSATPAPPAPPATSAAALAAAVPAATVRVTEPSWRTLAAPTPGAASEPEPTKPAAAGGDDAFAGLEDFLSAELDFGLDDVNWNDEPASEAPEVRLDNHKPAPETARAESAKPEAKPEASKPEAPKTPPVLTLEEEMERLLGDFNFETSDRKPR